MAHLTQLVSPNGSMASLDTPTTAKSIFSPIDGTFDSPATSPEASPVRPKLHRSSELKGMTIQMDGVGYDSSHVSDTEPEDLFGEDSPLVLASFAKVVDSNGSPSTQSSSSRRRRPSLLLRHCERHATSRQRQLMAASIRSPDRFVPNRASTPTKDSLYLMRPNLGVAKNRNVMETEIADPFAPPPRRSIRMAEQYATLRAPMPLPRDISYRGTAVSPRLAAGRRAVSDGAIWSVGGTMVTKGVPSTTNGRGGRVTSGTSAPHYIADLLRKASSSEAERTHGRRLAVAMDVDQGSRMLNMSVPNSATGSRRSSESRRHQSRIWNDCRWDTPTPSPPAKTRTKLGKDLPIIPFRVLDAPALRDDFYCSLLAYSPTLHSLAVGLGPHVYLWSEVKDISKPKIPDSLAAPFAAHVTSLSFSSRTGGSAILAIGRADGRVTLWSPLDKDPRFDSEQPAPVSIVCFRPNTVSRPSIRDPCVAAETEELLVGDEIGNVYFYSIEWPNHDQRDLFNWHGSMTLLGRLNCHSQQICGIAWSPDGNFFATGGNDNLLFLFSTKKVLRQRTAPTPQRRARGDSDATVNVHSDTGDVPGQGDVFAITPGLENKTYVLNAAVKAIAFAPWQPSLIAAGGGSNDRCIHFFHILSGASLATIDCHAQVTSLVFSEKRKEIAATFGFAQPEHPYRVAVFAWPSCRLVVGIPWFSEERALFAIAYPRGPASGLTRERGETVDKEGKVWSGSRTAREGCLVVATSDASIKFHEVWADTPGDGGKSTLGGSSILEGCLDLEKVDRIR
ncbi:hypothetical protein LTR62_007943 [Meristemomyces frigidus]|uniref:WD40 repeat-like protein n=1 Tax=Meristemomyces frigidus TaxID=1508187 RepID=A0AAN7YIP4_9PEZI|nr:hypothetical protein LTR62_007943 [Meristemomyces frigidus]